MLKVDKSELIWLKIFQILKKYHSLCPEARNEFSLKDKLDVINKSFDSATVEEIIQNLKNGGSDWELKTVQTLSKMSPTSMKITFKLLELGSQMDLQECLGIEYRLSQRCCENHDFVEGKSNECIIVQICEILASPNANPVKIQRCSSFVGG